MQAAEQQRQANIQDLQSYGIDPSSGRYNALDTASRVQAAASAAGAGNQQRMADIAQGNTMQQQAVAASLQNVQTGYGASNAANSLLATGMSLKYPPLGQTTTATGQTVAGGQSLSQGTSFGTGFGVTQSSGTSQGGSQNQVDVENKGVMVAGGGPIPPLGYAAGGASQDDATGGGFVSQQLSPSAGARTDDVPAQLNAGEFVIPKDVSAWKGQEFFYKLMASARKDRAMAGSKSAQQAPMGYENGGYVPGDTETETDKQRQEREPKEINAMGGPPSNAQTYYQGGGAVLPYGGYAQGGNVGSDDDGGQDDQQSGYDYAFNRLGRSPTKLERSGADFPTGAA
jgi:hypothetical protein